MRKRSPPSSPTNSLGSPREFGLSAFDQKRAIVGTSTEWREGMLLGTERGVDLWDLQAPPDDKVAAEQSTSAAAAGSSSSHGASSPAAAATSAVTTTTTTMTTATTSSSSKSDPRIKGPWSPEEDALLTKLVLAYGDKQWRKWSVIAQHVPGRIGKQCRERWLNNLDTSVKKTPWTQEEDDLLLRYQAQLGNRWCEISKLLPGRPENSVKNRYNSLVARNRGKEAKKSQSTGDAAGLLKDVDYNEYLAALPAMPMWYQPQPQEFVPAQDLQHMWNRQPDVPADDGHAVEALPHALVQLASEPLPAPRKNKRKAKTLPGPLPPMPPQPAGPAASMAALLALSAAPPPPPPPPPQSPPAAAAQSPPVAAAAAAQSPTPQQLPLLLAEELSFT